MEATIEERTPLRVLKQPQFRGVRTALWTHFRAGGVCSNSAGAGDIERRTIPKFAIQFHHQPGSSASISRTAASIERVTFGGAVWKVLTNSLSSSGEPMRAVSIFCRSFLRSTFVILTLLLNTKIPCRSREEVKQRVAETEHG